MKQEICAFLVENKILKCWNVWSESFIQLIEILFILAMKSRMWDTDCNNTNMHALYLLIIYLLCKCHINISGKHFLRQIHEYIIFNKELKKNMYHVLICSVKVNSQLYFSSEDIFMIFHSRAHWVLLENVLTHLSVILSTDWHCNLDMPSSIYNSIRVIKPVSVVFFWVTISSTHYERPVLLTERLFVYIFIHKQSTKSGYLSICLEIIRVYGNGLAMLGSLAMCTVYTHNLFFGTVIIV